MMNVLALILVALPALTTSQGDDIGVCCNMKRSNGTEESTELSNLALLSMDRWRDLYNRIQEGSRASLVRREYVCCNQPPTPPSPGRRNLRGMAPFMAKRGDKYTLLKRFFEDFGQDLPQRDQEAAADNANALPSDLSALAMAAGESGSGSRASRQEDSLLRRLLEGARARSVLENLAQQEEEEGDSALYDYPAKRGTFVRADGNKRHRKRHMHRHKKHRKH